MPSGVQLTLTANPSFAVRTAARRGLQEAGAAVLVVSNGLAPREPVPRHGVHMTETVFVHHQTGGGSEQAVAVGYRAYWALFQHEMLSYHHPHGGVAKFLELAVLEMEPAVLGIIARNIQEALL